MLLDQLLDGLDVSVSAFAICEVRSEASLVLEDDEATSVHYVLSGEGVARSIAGPDFALRPHTVMIAPPGTCVIVSSNRQPNMVLPAPHCESLPGGWMHATVGDGAPGIRLACGAVRAIHRESTGLFDYLRAPLVECVDDDQAFREPFHRLLDELANPQPGTKTLAESLMKQCLVVLLRRHTESGECRVPWLAALEHPRLGRAVSAMLDAPESPFTLQILADTAHMSRATFAEHFKAAFDRTAMDFLKEIRLRRAGHMLRANDLPVKTVAARVGFSSRSYFSRAFKAFTGVDPATYRANAIADAARPADSDSAGAGVRAEGVPDS